MKYFFLPLLSFLSFTLSSQESWPKKITSVEGITEYKLENGLRVLLFPDQSKQTITVNVTYLVGSRHEGYGESGMAHLLEHLVFKGTPDHKDIPKELSDHGARPNGTTWYDRTNYFETVAATEENLRWALDLESDRMVNSFIAKEDLDSEMTVVRNEFESGENNPMGVLMKRVTSTGYSWHNYGNTTIGSKADLENVPIERLQAFYKKYYQPDNAVLLVAGKMDEESTLELVQEYFADIPKPERQLYPTYTEEPTQDGERFVRLERTGDVQVVSCMYHICSGLHKDYAALSILMNALTDRPTGRLYKNLIETKKAASQFGFSMSLKQPGYAYFAAQLLKEQSLEDAQHTLLSTLDSLTISPPTEKEVERAKANILKNIDLRLTDTRRVGLFISEFIAMGDWRMLFVQRDWVKGVTVEDVQAVAKKYFKPSNRTVGVFIPTENPDRVEIPQAPSVETLVEGYVGAEVVDQGEEFDPAPAHIEERTLKGEVAGAKYSFVPKDTKGNVVSAMITLRYGSESSLKGKQMAGSLAANMLDKGTTSLTREEIRDRLDALKAQLNVGGSGKSTTVRIQTTKENLVEVLGLAADILKNPTFPQNEFDALVQQRKSRYEQSKSQPNSIAFNELSKHMNPYEKDHINYVMSPEESIEALENTDLNQAKAFYDEYIGITDASLFTIVGEFDPNEIKSVIEDKFSDVKPGMAYKRVPNKVFNVEAANKEVITPDKANAMFAAQMDFKMSQEHPDYVAMYVSNYLIGGGFLNSRLATRIRQQDGLSYGVGSFFNADGEDDAATFGSYAILNPENMSKVEAAYKEEIGKVINEGFTQEELDAAKKGLVQGFSVDRSQDNYLMSLLTSNELFDKDMLWYEKFDKEMARLSLSQINKVVKTHIDMDKISIVKAGDFKEDVIKP